MNLLRRPFALALAALLLLALAAGPLHAAPEGRTRHLKVTFLDVGQGDAVLLRFPGGRVVLVDAGDDRDRPAERVILPYLRANGINAIDSLVLTHAHRDHLGGMPELVKRIPVREVIDATPGNTQMYTDFLRLLQEKGIPLRKLHQGERPAWDPAVDVLCMHPPKSWATQSSTPQAVNLNNESIVLRLTYGDSTVLLAGDAEKEAEREMIAHYAGDADFRAGLYKASHHGSRTSSSPEFLKRIQPAADAGLTAVISVGAGNSFGHPHAETLRNLAYYAKRVFRTDTDGTIESWSDGRAWYTSFTGAPNGIVGEPEIAYVAPDAVTVRWSTSRPSSSSLAVEGQPVVTRNELSTDHFVTATRLAPGTRYRFTVTSAHAKGDTVQASGTFATPIAPDPPAQISFPSVAPAAVVGEPATIQVTASGGDTLLFYEKAVSPGHLFATRAPVKEGPLTAEWTPDANSTGDLYVELRRAGAPVTVRRATLDLTRKVVVIDAAHNNFGATDLESMRLDLSFEGFDARVTPYRLNDAQLQCAHVLVIPEIAEGEALSEVETAALKKFAARGGGLLVTSRADYKGASNPKGMNAILAAVGADLRFNDDQAFDPGACTSPGSPWVLLPRDFDRRVVSDECRAGLFQSSCSILDGTLKPLVGAGAGGAFPVARTTARGYAQDSDAAGDAEAWPAGRPVTLDAADVLSSGARVAAFGSTHLLSPVYTWTATHQTAAYNRDVVRWLSRPGPLKDEELAARLALPCEEAGDPAEGIAEGAAERRGGTVRKLLERFEAEDPAGSLERTVKTLRALPEAARRAAVPALKPAVDRARHAALDDPALLERMRRDLETFAGWCE